MDGILGQSSQKSTKSLDPSRVATRIGSDSIAPQSSQLDAQLREDEASAAAIRDIMADRRRQAAEQQERDARIFDIQGRPYCKWTLEEKEFMLPYIQADIKRGQDELAILWQRAQAAIEDLEN